MARPSADLLQALEHVEHVFEHRLGKPEALCVDCVYSKRAEPEVAARDAQFDAVVRAYRARRLELPVDAIIGHSFGHGSALVHGSLRRLAWFVPSLLAASLETNRRASRLADLTRLIADARAAEAIYRPASPLDFSADERAAATSFFLESQRDALAAVSFDPAEAIAILVAAEALSGSADALVDAWLDAAPPAFERLVVTIREAEDEDADALRRSLFTERVRARLEARFAETTDPALASILSEAESRIAAQLR